MWFAGIDWADDHHDSVVIDQQGQVLQTKRVTHSAAGMAELVTWLRGFLPEGQDFDQLACIVETSHGLLVTALLEAGVPVYPVPTTTVARRRLTTGGKTDRSDALILARTGRSEWPALRRLAPDSPVVRELQQLTRDQDGLVQEQTRVLNQLTNCLKGYYPIVLQLFHQVHQKATVAFLRAFPTVEAARGATVEQILAVLQAAHYPNDVRKKAEWLTAQVQQPQLQADPVEARAKARLMLVLVDHLELLMREIAAYDQVIAQLWQQHPDHDLFASLPGVSKRLGPRLLAEWGDDRSRYQHAAQVQAMAGTAPTVKQSGNYRHTHMRRGCNKHLRTTLHLLAHQTILTEPWARLYYEQKRAAGKTYAMALRALANQWVRIIYAMWVKRASYDATIFLTAQQHHARHVA